MERSWLTPFGRWVEAMDVRIRREELRARLGEARANARKWRKKQLPRKGRSLPRREESRGVRKARMDRPCPARKRRAGSRDQADA